MNFITRSWNAMFGNATEQRQGTQIVAPATTAHENVPQVGIDGALQVSTVWACVTLIVENVASLPLDVFMDHGQGNRQIDTDSRLYQVLRNSPNKRQTSMEFWLQMLLNLVLRGNAYAQIIRDNKGEVIALWPLAADQVTVVLLENGDLAYVYRFGQKDLVFLEIDILHIRSMGNGVVGMAPLEYMRSSVGLAISAQNHTTKTFRKDARRPGVLMTQKLLTPDQRDSVKEQLGGLVSGSGNELYTLEADFKFEPLGMSPADIQLLESRQFAVQDLARWFGVPSVLINDTGETTALGSSVQQIVDGFFRLKLRPMLTLIEQAIVKRVFTPRQRAMNIKVDFDKEELLRMNPKERMEINAQAVQNGLRTRNEGRAKDNLPALTGGDLLTAQVNLIPVEMLGQESHQKVGAGTVPPQPVEQ